ncbi:MAG: hypothetical protein AUJ74_07775 [Candidatus Omnitrophica bacterium CG1_02_44_16]|nr:MAG: hypothetical protein AUJ74_07775 [Candidatus Omnitrophica bacterium CG1_02_44_16]
MKYTFKEFVDVRVLQDMTDDLYKLTGIPFGIITSSGEVIIHSGWRKICTDFHRKHPQTEKECIDSNINIRNKIKEGKSFVVYECPRGLVDAASPIMIEGEHVASVFTGQFFMKLPDKSKEQFFRQQAKKFGFDEEKYMEAFRSIPVLSEEKLCSALFFLSKLAQLLVQLGFARARELSAKERLSIALTSARMGTFEWDIALNKSTWDDNVHALLGTDPKAFTGKEDEFFNVIFTEDRNAVKAALAKAVETGAPYETEYRVVWQDGSVHYIMARGQVYRFSFGAAQRMVGVCWDVTAQKKIEEEFQSKMKELQGEQYFIDSLVNDLPGLFYFFDEQGTFLRWNKDLEKVSGFSSKEISGMKPLDFFVEPGKDIISNAISEAFRNGKVIVEADLATKDGKKIPYMFSGSRIGYEYKPHLVGMGIDLSAVKKAQKIANDKMSEMEKLNRFMMGREVRIIELKREIDLLLKDVGKPPKYKV